MRPSPLRYTLLPLFAVLLLSACHGKDDPTQPGGSTPEAALRSSVELLKAGDLNGLWKHALPPVDYANMRADWNRHDPNRPPVSAEDRATFDEQVRKFTAPDAENKLDAELQPKLAAMKQKYSDQLPVLISVGEALVKNSLAQNRKLTNTQKTQLDGVLDALAPWAQKASWFDQAKAHQAIGVAVATARKLDLKSPEQLRAMDFDAAMGKYSTGYIGLKQLLAIYGLSLDDTFDSIKLTPVSSSDGRAVVKIDYILLGKPLSAESTLVQQDGRWYSEDMLANVRRSHQQLSQPPASSASAAVAASVAKD